MVVFEVQMKKLKDFTKSFDDFRIEAEEYFKQLQTKSEVIVDEEVPEELKFIEYVPAYEAKQAYSNFIQHKSPKVLKWLKVDKSKYQDTVFATMVKNDSLGEEFKNKWLLFDSSLPPTDELKNQIILSFHPQIEDSGYKKKGLSIKSFDLKEETRKVGMFDETIKKILLSSADNEVIEISQNLDKFEVVGVKY